MLNPTKTICKHSNNSIRITKWITLSPKLVIIVLKWSYKDGSSKPNQELKLKGYQTSFF